MKKCDPRVYALCPDKEHCGAMHEAVFSEGSECDKFNAEVLSRPMTNGDFIRSMNDSEIARFLTEAIMDAKQTVLRQLGAAGFKEKIVMVDNKLALQMVHLKWLKQPIEK